ncbi:endolytic transglycosylase MltG [Cupidesulfovibrio sp. SRB-5]|nr:endolytic transglycosylase MltG [Nitratidesulfovibrio sp. SRB-5]
MVRILLRALAALVLLVLLTCGYAGYDAWRFLHTPPASPGADVYVDVEPGATFDRVTRQLVDKGAVASDWRFKLLAHYHGWETSLKAGRFLVHSNWTPFRVLDQLVNGQPVLSRITLREGLTWWETARLLEVEGFVTVEDFRAVITDPAFLRHWGIPFDTAEGFLFPDTYLIKKPTTPDRESARAVAGRMVDTFWRRAAQVWPDGRPARDELRRLIILASIVEKETGQPSERGRVAGVYANRLRTGMLLQADPTTIYGLGDTFDGNLRRSHLQDAANPYNTYRRPGLPPGPICSPGLESLRAATTPEKHSYFYFVSRNDGSHQFSATLDEHNRAVNRYQRAGRAKGGDQAATQGTPASSANPAAPQGATPPTDAAATPASTDTAVTATEATATGAQDKTPASAAGGKPAVPAAGDQNGDLGTAPSRNPAPDAEVAKPAAQPAPADTAGTGSTGTSAAPAPPVPAVPAAPQPAQAPQAPQSLKVSPGAKPAPTPLPRTNAPAANGTTGATGANATAPASAGVRAPTAPREAAQSARSPLAGASAAGSTAATATTGAAGETPSTATATRPATTTPEAAAAPATPATPTTSALPVRPGTPVSPAPPVSTVTETPPASATATP